ncbi:MAG: cytochrome c oxidase subunit II [Dehalococcoidales bacterium]|nr:cytochrome c oxidase subunit II [Dehalococcoidales bacterium]
MWRHIGIVTAAWVVLTTVLEMVVANVNIYPVAASEEANLIDEAFQTLMYLAIPVFTLVVVIIVYSLLRFRGRGPADEGSPFRRNTGVAIAWLTITAGLSIFVIFNPGLTGLKELASHPAAQLEIQVEAEQWHWNVSYPQYGVYIEEAEEMFLPAGQAVRVELTSTDVIHSFWVPAFRLKQDAVPGQVNNLYFTPNRIGNFDEDFMYRVQCAELCGTGHARMRMRLAVVEPENFEEWIAQIKAEQ